jgi:hypothetical protein
VDKAGGRLLSACMDRSWTSTLRREWSWAAALLVGCAMRAFRLLDQLPVDDEWHAIHRVLGSSYREIALDFGFVDHCIPLTLYLKLVAQTIGLNEWWLRAPSFLAGVALLIAAPLALRPQLGARGTRVFAWLLAIAPLLVFYSRFQRPYAIATLLSFLALVQFERWWREGRTRQALGYASCAAASAYFLLPTLPFVAAPLALMGVAVLSSKWALPARRLALPLGSFAALCALLLLPPLLSHPEAVLSKVGGARPDLPALGRALLFLAGTPTPWIAVGLFGLALAGAWRARQAAPLWLALAGSATVALLLGVLASAPRYAWLGFVIARYALPALPIALACVALAIEPPDASARGRFARSLAATALVVLLLWSGGVPATLLSTRSWFPGRFVTELEGDVPRSANVPDFYRALAASPSGSLTVVESPWFYSLWNNLLPFYEQVHRQRTLVGFSAGTCTDGHWGEIPLRSGIAFDGFAYLDDRPALERRGVDFVVFHADLTAELERVIDPIDARATGQPDVRGCVQAFLDSDWPLVYRDSAIAVFAAPTTRALPRPE